MWRNAVAERNFEHREIEAKALITGGFALEDGDGTASYGVNLDLARPYTFEIKRSR